MYVLYGDYCRVLFISYTGEFSPNLKHLDLRTNGLGKSENFERGAAGGLKRLLQEGCCDVREIFLGHNNFRAKHIKVFAGEISTLIQ
jgi:hypothetical protein